MRNHIIQERLLWIFTNIYVCGNYNNLVIFFAKHAIPFGVTDTNETSHLISEYANIELSTRTLVVQLVLPNLLMLVSVSYM